MLRKINSGRVSSKSARRLCRAFSLLELLITLGIVLVLSVLMYGKGSSSFQKKQKAACQKNLHNLFLSLDLFAKENGDAFPVKKDAATSEAPLGLLMPKYTTTPQHFICPGTKESPISEGANLEKERISYAYYMGTRRSDTAAPLLSDKQVDDKPKGVGDVVFSTDGKKPGNNHEKYGGNVLLTSGDVESMKTKATIPLPLGEGVVLLNPKK